MHDGPKSETSGRTDFQGAHLVRANFNNATIRFSDVSGMKMRSVDVDGLDSHDLFFGSLIVNGEDVVPLVDAELNRQFPGRELQKAETPDGLRGAWVAAQAAWQEQVAATPPELYDAHVENEWSLTRGEFLVPGGGGPRRHRGVVAGALLYALDEEGRAPVAGRSELMHDPGLGGPEERSEILIAVQAGDEPGGVQA